MSRTFDGYEYALNKWLENNTIFVGERFLPSEGEYCSFIVDDYGTLEPYGEILSFDGVVKTQFACGNYFDSDESAQLEIDRLKVIADLKLFTNKQGKYIMVYDPQSKELKAQKMSQLIYPCLKFESEEKVKEAILEIGSERIQRDLFQVCPNKKEEEDDI